MKNKIKKIINKKRKKPIICLTAYSKSIAKITDKYCDLILVGDSLANVLYGMKNTHSVNMNMMIRHTQSVKMGVKNSLLIVDMPKNSYRNSKEAKRNAKRILKETKCDGVKIESNNKNFKIIKDLVKSNIPVMGHIGFTPQFHKKFSVAGKSTTQELQLLNEAVKIERAGAFSIILECIKTKTAKRITERLNIPTIGIGSSKYCDGQILVTDDLIGLSGFYPKFVKRYINLEKIIAKAIQKYRSDVLKKLFPKNNNSY